MADVKSIGDHNIALLRSNPYPGRGIVVGMSPDAKKLVQLYWIMGRSENSRNRIFVNENGFIKTKAWDADKVKDPSLIIYYAAKHRNGVHIVSNGDQTDTIYESLGQSGTFEGALDTRTFEPDAPNYTPRISGLFNLNDKKYSYKLSIIKSVYDNPGFCVRQFYCYEKGMPGFGHCLHTYSGDGDPLPSFDKEPYIVPLFADINVTINFYWHVLNEDNRISLFAKYVDLSTGEFETAIINKNRSLPRGS